MFARNPAGSELLSPLLNLLKSPLSFSLTFAEKNEEFPELSSVKFVAK